MRCYLTHDPISIDHVLVAFDSATKEQIDADMAAHEARRVRPFTEVAQSESLIPPSVEQQAILDAKSQKAGEEVLEVRLLYL